MNEFCQLCIVAVLFALTFVIAGWTASAILEGVRHIGCNCMFEGAGFIFAAMGAIVALIFAFIGWLTLHLGKMPSWFVLPVWILTFASVVTFLSFSGESAIGLYLTGFLWLPATLLVVGIFYLYLVLHYSRSQHPTRRTRNRK